VRPAHPTRDRCLVRAHPRCRSWRLGALLACSLASSPALEAATFVVGAGAGCTHATLASAVAAAAANGPGDDTIRLAVPSIALPALVDVVDQGVLIFGGYSSCTATTQTGRTTITGGGSNDAFWVHGAATEYRSFVLSRVTLDMTGSGLRPLRLDQLANVVLDAVDLVGGSAIDGGNVWMSGQVILQILGNSQIRDGVASDDGGGIYCEAGGQIFLDGGSDVHNNWVDSSGGGIYADDCDVTVRSGETADDPAWSEGVWNNNSVDPGGGIAAVNGSTVALTGLSRDAIAGLISNSTSSAGGGLYLSGTGTTGVARNARIQSNGGNPGGGVFVGVGATFTMDVNSSTCSAGRGCSDISDNYTTHPGGMGGAAIGVATGGGASVRQTEIHYNHSFVGPGGSVAAVASGGSLYLEGCEIHDNDYLPTDPDVSRFRVLNGSTVTVAFSTLVEDTVAPGVGVFEVEGGATFELLSSIIHASTTFEAPAAATLVDCVITKETASFPAGGTEISTVTDPLALFVNPAQNDYRLRRSSPAIDYCDTFNIAPTDTDIDGDLRGFDAPPANNLGTFDLGADEWLALLFVDGFETGNAGLWSASVP